MDRNENKVKARRRGNVTLAYIKEYRDRHGKMRRYFRRPGQSPAALPGLPGSPEFLEAYQAAFAQQPQQAGKALRSPPGTVSAAIAAYYASPQWRTLARSTQVGRRRILEILRSEIGDKPIAKLERRHIVERLAQCKSVRNWMSAIRELMKYAVEAGLRPDDPTDGIKAPKPPRKADDDDSEDGYRTWTEEEIAQFEARWPIGSKARLAFALALCTAQRRSDIIRMGPGMVKNGVITLRQKKTKVLVHVPIDPRLREIIDASKCGDMVYLVTIYKRSYLDSSLSGAFRTWCDKAGLPEDLSLHGLRKAWCRRAWEAGAPASEIMSVTGHKTLKEVERYIAAVDTEKLAHRVIARISGG
jgi:integrase